MARAGVVRRLVRRTAIRGTLVAMAKPEVHAWFLGEEITEADPLAAVKWRARDLDGAAEVLEQAAKSGTVAGRKSRPSPAPRPILPTLNARSVRRRW